MTQRQPKFDVSLSPDGRRSRVWMNGDELHGVREVTVTASLKGATVVTIEFLASGGVNWVEPESQP